METRVNWVDYAKGIGIILVVYGHVARGLYNAGISMPDNLYHLIDSIIYSFHMPLFFFLSGLFFYSSLSKKGVKSLLFSKVDTILYPYLIWSFLQGGTELLLSNYATGNVTLAEVLSVWQPRVQFWFLYALFFVFVVSSVIYSFVKEKVHFVILAIACLLYVNPSILPDWPVLPYIYNNLVFFIFGIVFTKYKLYNQLTSPISVLITLISFFVVQYLFHDYSGEIYAKKRVILLLLAFVSIFFVVSLSFVLTKYPNRFIAFLGASSMAIYLMHILAGSGARIILKNVFDIHFVGIHLIVGCLVGIFFPILALKAISLVNIPYVFTAPVSRWLGFSSGTLNNPMR